MTARKDDKVREVALRRLREGKSVPEIAKELGVSETWVRRVGAAEGVDPRPVGRPPGTEQPPRVETEDAKSKARILYAMGMDPHEIAASMKRSLRTVYLYLQKQGPTGTRPAVPEVPRLEPGSAEELKVRAAVLDLLRSVNKIHVVEIIERLGKRFDRHSIADALISLKRTGQASDDRHGYWAASAPRA